MYEYRRITTATRCVPLANGIGQGDGNLGLPEVAACSCVVLCSSLGDVDNRVVGEEDRTDQGEEHDDPNRFSTHQFETNSSSFLEQGATDDPLSLSTLIDGVMEAPLEQDSEGITQAMSIILIAAMYV